MTDLRTPALAGMLLLWPIKSVALQPKPARLHARRRRAGDIGGHGAATGQGRNPPTQNRSGLTFIIICRRRPM